MLHVRLSTCAFVHLIFVIDALMLHLHYRVFNDTFPADTSYVRAWPARRATIETDSSVFDSSNSNSKRHKTRLGVVEPVTPTDDCFEENYPQDISAGQLSNILSGNEDEEV